MACLKSSQVGSSPATQGTVEPYRPFQVSLMEKLAGMVTPALGTAGPVPGSQFAPGGPNVLMNRAFGEGANLMDYLRNNPAFAGFNPNQITSAMAPVGEYAQNMFQQQTIPAIMGALGPAGASRSSGAIDILGREGRNLSLGLASQFAPMQFAGLQEQLGRQAQMPALASGLTESMYGLGAQQRGIGEAQKDYALAQWQAGQPWTNPALNYLSAALGQPMGVYSNAPQVGYRDPSWMQQFFGMA